MRKKPRWLKSVLTAAESTKDTPMPFERGNRTPSHLRRLPPQKPRLQVVKA